MKELSLNILDIAMNSVRAGAKNVEISIFDDEQNLRFDIKDDGCGMSKEQLERLSDPFFTTRSTRKVGLGIPFLSLAAQQTGGGVKISSIPLDKSPDNHGTTISAVFCKNHIDFTPLGDIVSSVLTLVQGYPDIDFVFIHDLDGETVRMDTREIKQQLGEGIPINCPEILAWIKEYLSEQYSDINTRKDTERTKL